MPTVTGLATSFIQFTRASNATVTDSNGFIEWAGHNLLTNSESFDASAWSKTGATVSANSTVAPNATTTADTVTATAGTSNHCVFSANVSAIANVNNTVGVYLKKGTHNYITLIALGSSTSWVAITVDFSGATPVVSQTGAGAAGTYVTSGVDASVNGFYRVWFTGSHTTVPVQVEIALASSATPTYGSYGEESWNAAGTETVIAWGAHLYRSDLGGMVLNPARGDAYYPTTPRNLLGYTEAFDNAGWTRYELLSFGSGSVANATIAPNGLQTADLITENTTATASHFIYQDVVFSGTGTLSVYAKSATGNRFLYLRFLVTANNWATSIFDLATGSVTQQSNGSSWSGAYDATITTAGNGWYRCSLKVTASSVANVTFGLSNSGTPSLGALYGDALYTGDGTSGIYLWGAQLSDSASLDTYSPVYGAAVTSAAYYAPRLDFDPVTLAAKGLLVEEQRTNLFTYSADFSDASWAKGNVTVSANVAGASAVAPDGTNTADKMVSANATAETYVEKTVTSTTVAHAFSVYVKADGATFVQLLWNGAASTDYANFNLSLGTVTAGTYTDATITPVGNSWYRIVIVSTLASTSATALIWLLDSGTAARASSFTGDGVKGILLYGAQLEANASFATSYIPTGAASATRSVDVASVSTQAFPYSSTEGTVVVAWSMIASKTQTGYPAAVQLDAGSGTAYIAIRQDGTGDARRYGIVQTPTTTVAMLNTTAETPTANTVLKAGLAFKQDDFAFTRGSTLATNSSGLVPGSLTTMRLGNNEASIYVNCHIRQITYLPRRISNAELQQRTA